MKIKKNKTKLKKGDQVIVISGSDKHQKGVIEKLLAKENKAIVSGINLATKHRKRTPQNPTGGLEKINRPIHLCKLAFLDPKSQKPTRLGYKIDAKTGQKQRVSKRSQQTV